MIGDSARADSPIEEQVRQQINRLCAARGCYAAELEDVRKLRKDLPLLIVRAGRDQVPLVNESIDHLMRLATASGVPITLVEYQDGVHAFDFQQKNERSAEVIKQTLEFMSATLAIE